MLSFKMRINYLIFCLSFGFASFIAGSDLIVRLPNGNVKGRSLVSYFGKDFRAFQAIPYGKSTAGTRRFKPPEPVDDWEGVFDATHFGEECPQFNFITRGVEGSEDCLLINVYTPWKEELNTSLPVMVFIHGGAFIMGSGNYPHYPPEKLMDYNIVLVTLNYRLGILGFLNTQDNQSYGNFGMLDQVLALKWVQKNIEHFGGNPNKVTIFGESAGGGSVAHHLLSPLSKGLFHGAIAQSGSALSPWAYQARPLLGAHKVAAKLNCPVDNTKDLVQCLKDKSFFEIVDADRSITKTQFFPHYWSPMPEAAGGPGFLTKDPWTLLKNKEIANPVPLIIGVLADEGYLFHKEFLSLFNKRGAERASEVPEVLKILMKDPPNYGPVYEAIQKHYFDGPNIADDEAFANASIRYLSDSNFKVGVAKTLDFLSDAGFPVYAYKITHITQHSLAQLFSLPAGKFASHGDELFLQFPMVFTQFTRMNVADTKMAFIINSAFSSFADILEPQVVVEGDMAFLWERHSKENPQYFELKIYPEMVEGALTQEVQFWTETIPKLAAASRTSSSEL